MFFGLAKINLQRTAEGKGRPGRQKKWADIVQEWTGLEFARAHTLAKLKKLLKMEGADIKCINCGAPRTIAYEQALRPPALPPPPKSCLHATRTTGFGIDRFIQYLDLKTLQFEVVWLVHSIFNLGEYNRIPKVTIPHFFWV